MGARAVAEAVARQSYGQLVAWLAARAGELVAADRADRRAIGLEPDPAVRRFLDRQRIALGGGSGSAPAAPRPNEVAEMSTARTELSSGGAIPKDHRG